LRWKFLPWNYLQNLKQHIGFKIAALVLVATMIIPTAVKFAHIFNHHKHETCRGEYQAHLHTSYPDCSFHKFKLTTPFTIPVFAVDLIIPKQENKTIITHYLFLSEYQQLHFSLRGPPQLA